jgi:hypothetical protein
MGQLTTAKNNGQVLSKKNNDISFDLNLYHCIYYTKLQQQMKILKSLSKVDPELGLSVTVSG